MGHKIRKTHHTQQTRILALDVHPRSFGYVVVESPDKLLDWGVRRSYQKTKNHPEVLVGGRLRRLLKIWRPGAVVTRIGDRRNKDVQSLFRHIKKEAGTTSFLPITGTRDYYLGRGKYQRAVEIAKRFPEIGWKLPPKRKLGDSGHYLMSMFEALAIAVQCDCHSVEYGLAGQHEERDQKACPKLMLNCRLTSSSRESRQKFYKLVTRV